MLRIISKSLKTGVITEASVFAAQASFGFPVIDFTRCTACEECARSCPTGAIQTGTSASGRKTLSLSYGACIQCRECVAACPDRIVSVSREVDVAAHTREQLTRGASFRAEPATGRWVFEAMEAPEGLTLAESGARLRARLRGRLGR